MHRTSLKYLAASLLTLHSTLALSALYAQQPSPRLPPSSTSPQPDTPLYPQITQFAAFKESASAFIEPSPSSSSIDSTDPQTPDQQPTARSSDAPPSQPQNLTAKQSKRVLGVIPNFRAVGTNAKLPPQSVKDKFVGATEDSFDYSSTIIPALLALYGYESNSVPQFGRGGVAFGRYLWHSTVDQTTENYMVEFFVPVATHEDTRYYTLGHGGFFKRTGYALSRAVITRSDSGKETFNISEIVGAGASAGMSNLYYPEPQRTLSTTANNWSLDIALDASTFVLREFWPDIDHRLFHDK